MDTDDAILGSLTWVPMGKAVFYITSPKPITEIPNFPSGCVWVIYTSKIHQNKISFIHNFIYFLTKIYTFQ